MQLSSIASSRRVGTNRPGVASRARVSVVARDCEERRIVLKQDFSEWMQDTWHEATTGDARNKIWRHPSDAGALDVDTFRGLTEGRMLLGKGRTQVRISKGISFKLLHVLISLASKFVRILQGRLAFETMGWE